MAIFARGVRVGFAIFAISVQVTLGRFILRVERGSGLKIVGELIKALDGRFEQKFGTAGSTSILTFPYSERTARPREQRLRRERHCGK